MKKIFLLLFLILAPVFTFSQMILVNLEELYTSGGPEASRDIPIGLESMIMDELFDWGYIVFNVGAYNTKNSAEDSMGSLNAKQIAQANGAKFVLNVDVEYKLDTVEDVNYPVRLHYYLVSMESQLTMDQGHISFSDKGETPQEKYIAVTSEVLSRLKNQL